MSSSAVLVVSSHVVRGSVGARAAFALERLGHRVWTLPTVVLPWHPGHGRSHRMVPDEADFAALCADLARAPWLGELGAVMTGYLGEASQAGPIEELIAAVKAANPSALVLVDPVIGDEGGLYVAPQIVEAQRRLLLRADVTTPNRFELAFLTGRPTETMGDLADAARGLGPARVVVTSAPAMMRGKIGTALVSSGEILVAENPLVPRAPNGTGDLFAALFLSRLLGGFANGSALEGATAGTFELVARSVRDGSSELELAAHQDALVRPVAMVDMRAVASGRTARPRAVPRPAGSD